MEFGGYKGPILELPSLTDPVEEVELQVFPDPGLDAGPLDGTGGEPVRGTWGSRN